MAKLNTSLLLFISISITTTANNLDSLKSLRQSARGADLIQIAILIGNEYYKKSIYDTATYFYKTGLEEATHIQDYISAGKISNNLGVIEYRRGYPAKAIINYNETLEFYQKTGNDTLVGNAYINLGMAYKKLAINDKALLILQDGVRILERLNEDKSRAKGLNAIGNIYKQLKDFDRAFEFHNRSLKLLLLQYIFNHKKKNH